MFSPASHGAYCVWPRTAYEVANGNVSIIGPRFTYSYNDYLGRLSRMWAEQEAIERYESKIARGN